MASDKPKFIRSIKVVVGSREIIVQSSDDGRSVYLSNQHDMDIGWLSLEEAIPVSDAIREVVAFMKEEQGGDDHR